MPIISQLPNLMAFIKSFYSLNSMQHLIFPSLKHSPPVAVVPMNHISFFISLLLFYWFPSQVPLPPPAKCEPSPEFRLSPFLPVSIFSFLMGEIYSLGFHNYLYGRFSVSVPQVNFLSKLPSSVFPGVRMDLLKNK